MPTPNRRIRPALLLASSLVLLSAAPAHAQSVSIHADHGDSTWIVARVPLAGAPARLATRDGQVALVLLDTTLVLQLTDAGLRQLQSSIRDSAPAGLGQRFVQQMVGAALGSMFDHGIASPLSSIRRARADGTRLVLEGRDGHRVFANVEINGRDVMNDFSTVEATEFAARINRALPR